MPDRARLERLLGGEALRPLRQRLRARYERGATTDAFALGRLTGEERRALEGLLGRLPRSAGSMQLRQSELDQCMARAGLAADLRDALVVLDGPIEERRAQRDATMRAWAALAARESDPRVRALLDEAGTRGLIKRLSNGDAEHAARLLERVHRVIALLPARGMPLARLAATALGDAHALDAGRPETTLVLRACEACAEPVAADDVESAPARDAAREAARLRNRWARLGVTVHELAAPALCLNLEAAGTSPAARLVNAARASGEPLHLSLRVLLRAPPQWNVRDRSVFVCENPTVVAAATERFGADCAPLVCTDGMPAAAQRALLEQLHDAGARLRYHGDFDWPGLGIGNFVMRRCGATPWRFGTGDYVTGVGAGARALEGRRVRALWDTELDQAMQRIGRALDEEAVIDALLSDLG